MKGFDFAGQKTPHKQKNRNRGYDLLPSALNIAQTL